MRIEELCAAVWEAPAWLPRFRRKEYPKAFQEYQDRFGPLPPEGEELLCIVPLRRLGRKAGAERLILKNGIMLLHFVSHPDSPFYASAAFDHIIHYATTHFRSCELREDNGRRRMTVRGIKRVEDAVATLREMLGE